MSTVIKIDNLSKLYRLGEVGTGSIASDLHRWVSKVRGKEDPYAKIGVNDRTQKAVKGEEIWAIKDINLEIEQGEVLGIIGKNGAGKSTLLKILSRITSPTTGSYRIKGRMASLLEVGTGFHPEMTGRENIYMNGTIMGMRKREIDEQLDEIIDFAGVAKYIDTPVKRYSSGMTVRLGFSVAAHLSSEILVVDEVLAVGDAEFQKKAIGKMQDVSKGQGRTVLFVSHNMPSIKKLCNTGMVLQFGSTVFSGKIQEAIDFYTGNNYYENPKVYYDDLSRAPGNENLKIKSFEALPIKGEEINVLSGFIFILKFYNFRKDIMIDATFELSTFDDIILFHSGIVITPNKDSKEGYYEVKFSLPPGTLNAGKYKMKVIFGENQKYLLWMHDNLLNFEVANTLTEQGYNTAIPPGILRPIIDFNYQFMGL